MIPPRRFFAVVVWYMYASDPPNSIDSAACVHRAVRSRCTQLRSSCIVAGHVEDFTVESKRVFEDIRENWPNRIFMKGRWFLLGPRVFAWWLLARAAQVTKLIRL